MITLNNLTLRHGTQVLLENTNWTILSKQHIGIIGANGVGKTSLFLLLLNKLQPDVGDVRIPQQLKIAYVAQEIITSDISALEFVLTADKERSELLQALAESEANNDGIAIAKLHERLHAIDAYAAPARAAQLLNGLGFSEAQQHKTVSEFSGGWRVRLNLAKALMQTSDLLLLDEPTNHLDLDAILWLQAWLKTYPGTLLLISHDREFLDATVDHIAHFERQQIKLYTGNYSQFEKLRAEQLSLQQAQFEKQQKQIQHLQSYVDRFRYKATKAKQAQSRIKALERMEIISQVQTASEFQFDFKPIKAPPNPMLVLKNASIGYGEKTILANLNLQITPNDRIAILGVNGAGKSTLIKTLCQELPLINGILEVMPGVKLGYFAQQQVEALRLDESPIAHLTAIADNTPEVALRTFLGSFAFTGDKVFMPVKNFSGGEKSRLALALLIWQEPNLLLLDEPTNHLDMEMRNALSLALQTYTGALLLVSHDRFLIRSTTDQLWLVANETVSVFNGDLDDYQVWLADYKNKAKGSVPADNKITNKKDQRVLAAEKRERLRPLIKQITSIEKALEKKQQAHCEIEKQLGDSSLYEAAEKARLQQLLLEQAQLKKDINSLEEQWLALTDERDKYA